MDLSDGVDDDFRLFLTDIIGGGGIDGSVEGVVMTGNCMAPQRTQATPASKGLRTLPDVSEVQETSAHATPAANRCWAITRKDRNRIVIHMGKRTGSGPVSAPAMLTHMPGSVVGCSPPESCRKECTDDAPGVQELLAKQRECEQRIQKLDYELEQALKASKEKESENDHLAIVNRQKDALLSCAIQQRNALERDLGEKVKHQASIIFMLKSDLAHAQQQLQGREEAEEQAWALQQEEAGAGEAPGSQPEGAGQGAGSRPEGEAPPRQHVRPQEVKRRIAELELQVERLRVCPVCWMAAKELVYGCGHQICADCDARLQACPLCRAPVTKRIRIYQ